MAQMTLNKFVAAGHCFARQCAGGVAIIFALVFPVLLAIAGGTVDYIRFYNVAGAMQAAADASATAAAKEFQIGTMDTSVIASVAQEVARADLANKGLNATITPTVNLSAMSVTVSISAMTELPFLSIVGQANAQPQVSATAQAIGDSVVCLLALSASGSSSLALASASVMSPACAAHSNSNASDSLAATGSAKLTAALVCSSGGATGPQTAFSPQPMTDCPKLADPMAGRAIPSVAGCDQNNLVLNGGTHVLAPGVYCGGITAQANAIVTISGGVFVMKDGPLQLTTGAQLIADGAGVYLTGTTAVLNFDNSTSIDLKAPTTGIMAGMIFFEDPAAPLDRVHLIGSRTAPHLLGTIYLPRGKLVVGMTPTGPGPAVYCDDDRRRTVVVPCPKAPVIVGLQSDWTIVVANHVIINAGVVLTLNANYSGTSVQPPKEIVKKQVRLSH